MSLTSICEACRVTVGEISPHPITHRPAFCGDPQNRGLALTLSALVIPRVVPRLLRVVLRIALCSVMV